MLAMEAIEQAQTEWALAPVFGPRKKRTIRFCVNYYKLNTVIIRDSCPIARMNECINLLGDATTFFLLYANKGYWKLDVANKHRTKLALHPRTDFFKSLEFHFCHKHLPEMFQLKMYIILFLVEWQFALGHLDDSIIFCKSPGEHIHHVLRVLTLLNDDGVAR